MSEIQFDVNVANGVTIDVPNWRFVLTNQNHCYIPKLIYLHQNRLQSFSIVVI